MAMITRPNVTAMPTCPSACVLASTMIAPAPAKTSAKVPITSATSMRGRAAILRPFDVVRGVRELAELARHEIGDLLADVDGVVADPLEAPRHSDHPQSPLEPLRICSE